MPAAALAYDQSLTLAANQRRDQDGLWWRTPRWRHSRAQLWKLLDRHVSVGAPVAIVGAGNGHDLPLRRLATAPARSGCSTSTVRRLSTRSDEPDG